MSFWFSQQCTKLKSTAPQPPSEVLPLMTEARTILETHESELSKAEQFNLSQSRATNEWLSRVLRNGTTQDRINAIAFIAQERPLQCLPYLDKLCALVAPAKKRDCLLAMEALHGLFKQHLLPGNRDLISFDSRPLHKLSTLHKKPMFSSVKEKEVNSKKKKQKDQLAADKARERLLLIWIFENNLRSTYYRFLKSMEQVLMFDTIEATKRKAANILFDLLEHKSEAKKRLLDLLVNKIGDPNRHLASNIVHKLNKLVKHKNRVILDVLEHVEILLFRPNVGEHTQYYAVSFLNQLQLNNSETSQEMAAKLIKIYAVFFRAAVKDKEMNEKMLTALLSGVNRTIPFVKEGFTEIDEHLNTMFKLVHTTPFGIAIQALMVLLHVVKHKDEMKDRFYQALYRKLLDPELLRTSKQALLTHLLYKSLLVDTDQQRVKAFFKRIFQICCSHEDAGFVCAVLLMVAKLTKGKPEMIEIKPKVNTAVFESDDEEEHFTDVESSSEETEPSGKTNGDVILANTDEDPLTKISWDHRNLSKARPTAQVAGGYDAQARNPKFANALGECVWELEMLTRSVHPSVAIFASNVLENRLFDYTGNPFDDFSLAHFLERFVFKNPKPVDKKKKQSLTAPRTAPLRGAKSMAVNSEDYLKLDPKNIPDDERFFHKYFQFINEKRKKKPKAEKKSGEDDSESEVESVDDDEFDEYLDTYEKQMDQDADYDDTENLDEDELSDFTMSDEDFGLEDDDLTDIHNMEDFEDMDGLENMEDRQNDEESDDDNDGSGSEEESDEDEDIDSEEMSEGEESGEDESEDESSDDGLAAPATGKKRKLESSKMNKLFVSADEIGDMYDAQESTKEAKQRKWEDKRIGRDGKSRGSQFGNRGSFKGGRGSFRGDRGGRGSFRGARGSVRGDRGGRGSFRGDRGGRGSFRGDRGGRGSFRGGRGSFRGDRGGRGSFRGDRGGRGSFRGRGGSSRGNSRR